MYSEKQNKKILKIIIENLYIKIRTTFVALKDNKRTYYTNQKQQSYGKQIFNIRGIWQTEKRNNP